MAVKPFSLVGMTTSTVGTGTMTLVSAIPSYSSVSDAGVTDGDNVSYLIKSGNNRELGVGTVGASGTTLSRDVVTRSIISGVVGTSKIALTGIDEVYLTIREDDLSELMAFSQTFTLPTSDGTAGQILQTDGSGVLSFTDAAGGGGGLVPIGAPVVASNDAAVDISFTGGYSKYRIWLEHIRPVSDSFQTLMMRFSTDGSTFDSGGNDYAWTIFGSYPSSSVGIHDALDSQIDIAPQMGAGTGESLSGWIDIVLANGSTTYTQVSGKYIAYDSAPTIYNWTIGAMRLSTTAVTDARFFLTSVNIASGEFQLYGIAEGS